MATHGSSGSQSRRGYSSSDTASERWRIVAKALARVLMQAIRRRGGLKTGVVRGLKIGVVRGGSAQSNTEQRARATRGNLVFRRHSDGWSDMDREKRRRLQGEQRSGQA
ncbi:hypothetical protein VPH35_109923 [Triticum aestivum]